MPIVNKPKNAFIVTICIPCDLKGKRRELKHHIIQTLRANSVEGTLIITLLEREAFSLEIRRNNGSLARDFALEDFAIAAIFEMFIQNTLSIS